MFERTPHFEAFIAPAKRYPAFWRLLVGFVTAISVYMGATALGFALLAFILAPEDVDALMLSIDSADDPFTMFILLASFFGMALGAVTAAFWHWRGFLSLTGPLGAFGRRFIDTLAIAVPVFVISGLIITLVTDFELTSQTPLSTWLGYLALGLPLLFVQVSAEELIFRGYLTQQLAARFQSIAIWGVIPSILFGFAHFSLDFDPVTAGLIVLATGFFGFVATDLTRLTGNLGAATAFHFTNNFFALFLVAIPGELSGLALYLTPFTMADSHIIQPLILIDIAVVGLVWQILRRRYA